MKEMKNDLYIFFNRYLCNWNIGIFRNERNWRIMIKIIMIVSMLLLLNNCAGYGFYKNYKGNKLYEKQQKQLIETKKTWLNI